MSRNIALGKQLQHRFAASSLTQQATLWSKHAYARARLFRTREDGGIILLGLLFFVGILIVTGLAIDMTRFEQQRIRMQATADRAVLAATLMTETSADIDPYELAQAYFDAEGLGAAVQGRIQVHQSEEDGRVVRVTPQSHVNTLFMRMSGTDSLSLNVLAEAAHGRGIVSGGVEGATQNAMEVVFVLDVSGSMSGSRLANLKIAATSITEKLLRDATPGSVGMSIFTYADYVIPPTGMINNFPNLIGSSGQCMDFTNFEEFLGSYNQTMLRHQCKTSDNRMAQLYLYDADQAIEYINNLNTQKGTSIDHGVRWGAMMFDPSIQPVISELIAQGRIHPAFQGRPFGVKPDGPTQALILMTDGRNNPNGDRPGTREQYNINTLATCNALKEAGVIVYTVAFEAPGDAQVLMQQCASSPNHYFNTSGVQLLAAFETIGTHLETEEVFRTLQLTK